MMECTCKMILEVGITHGNPRFQKRKCAGLRQGILQHMDHPVHPQQEPLTGGISNCYSNSRHQ